ncbi:BCD family MFS transporter [Erythrobacter insulae]|uniref:BCD family MFS transporter n=1 Tax=Erythrobacter insulae TaxID=2584124 RepID=A0A547PCX9_9SPHN|nr:BCD family MFS transporter [Erythrobacter insulae]TRD11988.1 BCD family MFS transporter [Erythrobacter insulae]
MSTSPRPTPQKPGSFAEFALALLPFADAASVDLPLSRLLRLALFQFSVGMAMVLLNGTLNRVMIVELGTPAWIVALLIAVPLLVAPFRALIGHKSDTHRSFLGWKRVPYIWFGSIMQFGGLAIMPFALLLFDNPDKFNLAVLSAAGAFLLTGAGFHVTQTAGLALATDLAPEDKRPRAVALLYVMLLIGMMFSAFVIGGLLIEFSPTRLVQVIQGAAVLTMALNITALWKQEARNVEATAHNRETPDFRKLWNAFVKDGRNARLLTAIGIGAAGFAMQDALLEPFGGEVLGLSVGATTGLTGAWAFGSLLGFMVSGRMLSRGGDPLRIAGLGLVTGIAAFLIILFAPAFNSPVMLFIGAGAIGLGLGLFSVGTLIEAMNLAESATAGLALGAWGAVQATCAGAGIALGGALRDIVAAIAMSGDQTAATATRATGYTTVYILEILLLLAGLAAIGPLVGRARKSSTNLRDTAGQPFGLREFPT